jgi:hypothetical protein
VLFILPPVLGVVLGLLLGGSASNWDRLHVRWPWLIVVVLFVRVAIGFTPLSSIAALRYVYEVSLLGFVVWTLLQVKALPGFWIGAVGASLNLLVIVVNGGHMPVSPISGYVPTDPNELYVVADSATRINWLGDWIGIPGWLGGAMSPGDFLIAIGIGVVAFLVTHRKPPATKLLEETSSSMGR